MTKGNSGKKRLEPRQQARGHEEKGAWAGEALGLGGAPATARARRAPCRAGKTGEHTVHNADKKERIGSTAAAPEVAHQSSHVAAIGRPALCRGRPRIILYVRQGRGPKTGELSMILWRSLPAPQA